MAAANPAEVQSIITAGRCDVCVIPPGLVWYAILSALVTINNGGTVPTDPQTIINEAKCFECLVPPGLVPYAILGAVRDLSAAIGGGGGGGAGAGSVFRGVGSPEGVITSTTGAAIYYDENTGSLWQFGGLAGGSTGWFVIIEA